MTSRGRSRSAGVVWLVAVVLCSSLVATAVSRAAEEPAVAADSPGNLDASAELSGREIYQRVLANRHKTFFQKQRLMSSDAGGAVSETELWVRWKDGRDANGKLKRGVRSKTLAKYEEPARVRGTGYLIIQKEGSADDQFVYFPSARKVRRVSLSESIMGTDLSIEDIIPRDIDTADYQRDKDEQVDGVDCYVLDLIPQNARGSQYSKIRAYVEKEHFVTLVMRYWDHDGVEVKHYATPFTEIADVEGVWMTRTATMTDLLNESSTVLAILEMEPNAKVRDKEFTVRRLEQKTR